jgi:Holliday junction resolvase RusA-like endonuclease
MIIEIPGQTRAKKNGMLIITYGNGPKAPRSLKPSKLYSEWEKAALAHLMQANHPPWDKDYPIEIHFFLFRDSKRKWDIDNVFCGCLDVLQQMNIIVDDTANHVIPVFSGWTIDRQNPRVVLQLRPASKVYFREDLVK